MLMSFILCISLSLLYLAQCQERAALPLCILRSDDNLTFGNITFSPGNSSSKVTGSFYNLIASSTYYVYISRHRDEGDMFTMRYHDDHIASFDTDGEGNGVLCLDRCLKLNDETICLLKTGVDEEIPLAWGRVRKNLDEEGMLSQRRGFVMRTRPDAKIFKRRLFESMHHRRCPYHCNIFE
jgi:hypothetical protein